MFKYISNLFARSKGKTSIALANSILNTFGGSFLSSRQNLSDFKQWVNSENHFIPPKGFWSDPYILGYVLGLINSIGNTEFNLNQKSTEEKGYIILSVLQLMCREEWEEAASLFNYYANLNDRDKDFSRGIQDATMSATAVYGIEDQQFKQNPIYIQARLDSEKFKSMPEFSTPNLALSYAIKIKTLDKHIKEKYLS